MSYFPLPGLLALAALAAGAVSFNAHAQANTAPPGKSHDGEQRLLGDDNTYFHSHSRVRIPRGRMPPRGMCGLWYPEKKGKEQPQPFKCSPDVAVEPGGFLKIGRAHV